MNVAKQCCLSVWWENAVFKKLQSTLLIRLQRDMRCLEHWQSGSGTFKLSTRWPLRHNIEMYDSIITG